METSLTTLKGLEELKCWGGMRRSDHTQVGDTKEDSQEKEMIEISLTNEQDLRGCC